MSKCIKQILIILRLYIFYLYVMYITKPMYIVLSSN